MKSILTLALLSALAACSKSGNSETSSADAVASTPTPPASATPAATVDLDKLAARLVANAGVTEGEIVAVIGGSRDLELMENLATHVRKAGAFPLVVFDSSRMTRRSFMDVPAKYDSQPPKLNLALADMLDATINVQSDYESDTLADVPADRRAARSKANVSAEQKFLKNMRYLEVGNGLYPTAWRAEQLGVSEADLRRLFWEGVNVDYSELQNRAQSIRTQLAAAREVHITTPNGTDITLPIAGRRVVVSDGIISDEDRKEGGAARWVFLPAGEVMTTPAPGKATGKVVASRVYFDSKPIENLTLTFKDGKLVDMNGMGAGFEAMKRQYDADEHPNKSAFGFFDLGINPNLTLPAENKGGTWVSSGMVSVGIGDNTSFGGDIESSFGLAAHLTNATVTLDGKPIVENGVLKL